MDKVDSGLGFLMILITIILMGLIFWNLYLTNRINKMDKPNEMVFDIIYREFIPEQYRVFVDNIHDEMGFDYKLIYRLVQNESQWNHWARGTNADGSVDSGLCQLNSGNDWGIDLFNPEQNLNAGFKYLRGLTDRFGSLENGLTAYNAGPGRLTRGTVPDSTRAYVKRILK